MLEPLLFFYLIKLKCINFKCNFLLFIYENIVMPNTGTTWSSLLCILGFWKTGVQTHDMNVNL